MEEIALQIHMAGQEPHEIMAPPEIETGEFIRELIAGLRLSEDVIWEVDDKDTGHTLAPGRTLHDNGVRSGHHLYLKSREPVFVPDVDPKEKEPPIFVPPQPRKWPLILTLVLIPLAGAGGYFLGSSGTQQLDSTVRSAKAAAADANLRATDAESRVAKLQQELDDIRQKEGGASTQVNQLGQQVAQQTQELDRRQKQIKADQAQVVQLNQQIAQLHTTEASDQDQIKRLQAAAQASAQQMAALQNELNAKTQALAVIEKNVVASKGAAKQGPARPSYGWLNWSGDIPKGNVVEIRDNQPSVGSLSGKLPGMPCTVEPAEPENVSIEAAPDPGTAWNRVVFKVKGKGKTTVRLLWVVR